VTTTSFATQRATSSLDLSMSSKASVAATPRRARHLLFTAQGLDAVGTGFFLAGSAVYFTAVVGLSARQIGVGTSLAGLFGLVGLVLVGRLADTLDRRPLLVAASAGQGLLFCAYLWVHSFVAFLMVISLLGLIQQSVSPLRRAFIADLVATDLRLRTQTILATIFNAGISVGALGTAALVASHSRPLLLAIVIVNALSCAAAAVTTALVIVPRPARDAPSDDHGVLRKRHATQYRDSTRQRGLFILTVSGGALATNYTLFEVALPLYLLHQTAAPPYLIGVLVVLNTALVVWLQVPVGRLITTPAQAVRYLWYSCGALAAACLAAASASGGRASAVAALAVLGAAALLTLAELLSSAAGWSLIFSITPDGQQGAYQTFFSRGNAVQQLVGPIATVALVTAWGAYGWYALAGFFTFVSGGIYVQRGALLRAASTGLDACAGSEDLEGAVLESHVGTHDE